MKKLLLTTAAILATSPAWAWHPIVIYNNTDPPIHLVKFKSPGGNIAPQKFVVDILSHGFGVIGPLREDGGLCLRPVVVTLVDRLGEDITATAATPMNVCTEGWINVSWEHVYPGGDTYIVTHGLGSGAAGKPWS